MSGIATGVLIGSAVLNFAGSIFGASSASKRARREAERKAELTRELTNLENSRQSVINPYEGITDLSSMITDLSSIANNPYNSLAVATAATDMQIEQTDLALANTLDTLRATGAGAGGATALAQAALRSKRGVSATIEQQEAQNQRLAAQGAQQAQTARLAEGSRLDQGRMAGAQFEFNVRENREQMKIDRTAGLLDQQRARAASLKAQASQGFGQALGAIGGLAAGGLAGGKSFGENFKTNFGL